MTLSVKLFIYIRCHGWRDSMSGSKNREQYKWPKGFLLSGWVFSKMWLILVTPCVGDRSLKAMLFIVLCLYPSIPTLILSESLPMLCFPSNTVYSSDVSLHFIVWVMIIFLFAALSCVGGGLEASPVVLLREREAATVLEGRPQAC